MTKMSVIVPVYKVPLKYLQNCLDSLTDQILQECEFIIVLDGAPEAESSICENHAARDSRFRLFRREHAGVSATRNYGIKQVQGEYIAFVDSDDWIDSKMLLECYDFAKKRNSDIVTMDFYETKNNIDSLRVQRPKSTEPFRILHQILVGEIFGGMQLRIIKKKFYDTHQILFPKNIHYCEDVLFWAQFFQAQPKIDYFHKAFYHYVQDNSISITRAKYSLETYNTQKKYIYTLKDFLPASFRSEINQAALIVKMGAMSRKLLTSKEFMSFEKTSLRTLITAHLALSTKIYLFFNMMFYSFFNKPFREYL